MQKCAAIIRANNKVIVIENGVKKGVDFCSVICRTLSSVTAFLIAVQKCH
jgi:hypothetical protein